MTARDEVLAVLAANLPNDIIVLPYSRNLGAAPKKPTVMVRIDKVTPSGRGQGLRDYEFALVCVGSKTTTGPADDELDGLLEDVLFALEKSTVPNGIVWREANRATFEEIAPAYEVLLTVTINKEPQP